MNEETKSVILAILFGTVFLLIFIYCLVKFICRIWFECQKERINRRNIRRLTLNDLINSEI